MLVLDEKESRDDDGGGGEAAEEKKKSKAEGKDLTEAEEKEVKKKIAAWRPKPGDTLKKLLQEAQRGQDRAPWERKHRLLAETLVPPGESRHKGFQWRSEFHLYGVPPYTDGIAAHFQHGLFIRALSRTDFFLTFGDRNYIDLQDPRSNRDEWTGDITTEILSAWSESCTKTKKLLEDWKMEDILRDLIRDCRRILQLTVMPTVDVVFFQEEEKEEETENELAGWIEIGGSPFSVDEIVISFASDDHEEEEGEEEEEKEEDANVVHHMKFTTSADPKEGGELKRLINRTLKPIVNLLAKEDTSSDRMHPNPLIMELIVLLKSNKHQTGPIKYSLNLCEQKKNNKIADSVEQTIRTHLDKLKPLIEKVNTFPVTGKKVKEAELTPEDKAFIAGSDTGIVKENLPGCYVSFFCDLPKPAIWRVVLWRVFHVAIVKALAAIWCLGFTRCDLLYEDRLEIRFTYPEVES
jgi:hypothetical protein